MTELKVVTNDAEPRGPIWKTPPTITSQHGRELYQNLITSLQQIRAVTAADLELVRCAVSASEAEMRNRLLCNHYHAMGQPGEAIKLERAANQAASSMKQIFTSLHLSGERARLTSAQKMAAASVLTGSDGQSEWDDIP